MLTAMRARLVATFATLFSIATLMAATVVHHDSAADLQRAQDCLKSISKGALMYSQDSDDLLPAAPKHVAVVAVYVRHLGDFFPFPKDKSSVTYKMEMTGTRAQVIQSEFVFNPLLYGANVTHLKAPTKTVMWSYGPRKHLGFVFNGKSLVAFANGSTKFVTRAEAKKLRWKP